MKNKIVGTHTPGPRCTKCKWVHEADSAAGTSFQGVELCPEHAAAPDTAARVEKLEVANKELREVLYQCEMVLRLCTGYNRGLTRKVVNAVWAACDALAKAKGE